MQVGQHLGVAGEYATGAAATVTGATQIPLPHSPKTPPIKCAWHTRHTTHCTLHTTLFVFHGKPPCRNFVSATYRFLLGTMNAYPVGPWVLQHAGAHCNVRAESKEKALEAACLLPRSFFLASISRWPQSSRRKPRLPRPPKTRKQRYSPRLRCVFLTRQVAVGGMVTCTVVSTVFGIPGTVKHSHRHSDIRSSPRG